MKSLELSKDERQAMWSIYTVTKSTVSQDDLFFILCRSYFVVAVMNMII